MLFFEEMSCLCAVTKTPSTVRLYQLFTHYYQLCLSARPQGKCVCMYFTGRSNMLVCIMHVSPIMYLYLLQLIRKTELAGRGKMGKRKRGSQSVQDFFSSYHFCLSRWHPELISILTLRAMTNSITTDSLL